MWKHIWKSRQNNELFLNGSRIALILAKIRYIPEVVKLLLRDVKHTLNLKRYLGDAVAYFCILSNSADVLRTWTLGRSQRETNLSMPTCWWVCITHENLKRYLGDRVIYVLKNSVKQSSELVMFFFFWTFGRSQKGINSSKPAHQVGMHKSWDTKHWIWDTKIILNSI